MLRILKALRLQGWSIPAKHLCKANQGRPCAPNNTRLSFTRESHSLHKWIRNTMKQKEKFTVLVEGNIGSGKTSFLQHYVDAPCAEVIQEPVAEWRNVAGKGMNALALMYKDPTRWSLTFQTYVQLTMLRKHTQPLQPDKTVKLMERSIFSAKYCFVENLHNSGKMPDIEYVVLSEWFDYLIAHENFSVDLIVYLQTKPEVVHERIKKRCRKEEEAIPLDYLQALHKLHEDWLVDQTQFSLPAPVLIIDANEDMSSMKKVFEEHNKQILFGQDDEDQVLPSAATS